MRLASLFLLAKVKFPYQATMQNIKTDSIKLLWKKVIISEETLQDRIWSSWTLFIYLYLQLFSNHYNCWGDWNTDHRKPWYQQINTANRATARSDNATLNLRLTELTLGWFFSIHTNSCKHMIHSHVRVPEWNHWLMECVNQPDTKITLILPPSFTDSSVCVHVMKMNSIAFAWQRQKMGLVLYRKYLQVCQPCFSLFFCRVCNSM